MRSGYSSSFIIVLISLVTFYSCSNGKDDDHAHHSGKMILTAQIIHWEIGVDHGDDGGGHDSDPFIHTDKYFGQYDDEEKLHFWNEMEFIYGANGQLIATVNGFDSVHYRYSNGALTSVFTNCGYYDGGTYIDTTRFFYEGEILKFATSSHEETITDLILDSENHITSKFIRRIDPNSIKYDSLYYSWENGNLVKIRTRSGYPFVNYFYQREFRYDERPSFTSAINFPSEYLLVRELTQFYGKYPLFYYDELLWRYNTRNNPIEFIERSNDATRIIEYHIEYNEAGYPKLIHSKKFTMIFAYNGEEPEDIGPSDPHDGH